jgi:hypothetical protein
LNSIEQKLLFALIYQKSYPLQAVMGELFGMGQSQANEKKIHSDKNLVIATANRQGLPDTSPCMKFAGRWIHTRAKDPRTETDPPDL